MKIIFSVGATDNLLSSEIGLCGRSALVMSRWVKCLEFSLDSNTASRMAVIVIAMKVKLIAEPLGKTVVQSISKNPNHFRIKTRILELNSDLQHF